MSEKPTNRISHAPDWITSGLVKAAAFAEDEQQQPMFNTGVTFAQLKDQIKSILIRSGLSLTTREIGAGTHWLTQRVANQISEKDTKETLMEKLNSYVMQYVADKSVQRHTGVSERSPIYDRKWYDENMTPPTDREAAADEKPEPKKDDGAQAEEPLDMVYVGLDGDDMGHLVEESLLTDDPEVAAKISNSIHDAHRAIRKIVSSVGGRLIFDGGDNMLVYMPNDPDSIEEIRNVHKRITKHSVTIGVGHRPIEAHYSLVVGKNTGKNKTVIYNESVKAQHQTIHQEQEQLEDTSKKLKYRANSALDQLGHELNVSQRLRDALSKSGMDASDKSVKELFWKLIQQYHLDDMFAIDSFFASADDSNLVAAAHQTYARRLDWSLRCSEAREMTQVEGQALLHDLTRVVDSAESMTPKFKALIKSVDDQALRDIDEGIDTAWERAEKIIMDFAEAVIDGGKMRHSHYADEIHGIIAEVLAMALPIDIALVTALKAIENAESADNRAIDASPVVEIINRWIERINTMTMCLDMVCVVSGARPMEMVAADANSQPAHFPGQTVVPGGKGQKSPYARHDWLSIEDYNREGVDWRKTDDQYVSTNVSNDSESMSAKTTGGDVGGSAIYVP